MEQGGRASRIEGFEGGDSFAVVGSAAGRPCSAIRMAEGRWHTTLHTTKWSMKGTRHGIVQEDLKSGDSFAEMGSATTIGGS